MVPVRAYIESKVKSCLKIDSYRKRSLSTTGLGGGENSLALEPAQTWDIGTIRTK
jgi:hypothetical protein